MKLKNADITKKIKCVYVFGRMQVINGIVVSL